MNIEKENAWRKYKQAECFDSDGRANGFSKGYDAGFSVAVRGVSKVLRQMHKARTLPDSKIKIR